MQGGPSAPAEDAAVAPPDDDGDGLCDDTENEFATNPSALDTDGDTLPDLIELLNGFDATDPEEPAADQVGYLPAGRTASIDFMIRATVDGNGQGISGGFQSLASIYTDGSSAADFFAGASAVNALPVDGVRSIDEGSAYFAAVLGKTRLVFNLRFAYPFERFGEVDCARAYPFRFSIKTDDGETRAERRYLLVVHAGEDTAQDIAHCLPDTCQ